MVKSSSNSFLKRNFLEAKLSTLSLKEARSVRPEVTVTAAARILAENNYGCLLVKNKTTTLVGIVSERDIICRAYSRALDFATTPVESVMSMSPQTLPEYSSLARALYFMAMGGYRHIPIEARSTDSWLMLSVKDLVDRIYHRIAAPTINAQEESIADQSVVAEFFVSPVSILQPHPPVQVNQHASVHDTLQILNTAAVGSVVVTNSASRICGIFTERDYIQRVLCAERDPHKTPILDVMTPTPKTVVASSSVSLAFSAFSEGRYRHLPIVDANEQLLGILSVKNFIHALAQGIAEDLQP